MRNRGFESLLLKLGSRVREVELNAPDLAVSQLQDQLDKCEAWLTDLDHRAREASISLARYYEPFVDIRARLSHLQAILSKRRQPWWKRALFAIRRLVNAISTWFGLVPLLPEGPAIAGLLKRGEKTDA